MKKILLAAVFTATLFSAVSAQAYLRMTKRDGALTVQEATTDEIVEIFARNNYDDYTKERGSYPRIYMDHMPTDWKDIQDNDAAIIGKVISIIKNLNRNILV